MSRARVAIIILLGVAVAQDATVEVSSANANEHILKKIDPEYPPLAKAARIQGKVLLKATISKDGDVSAVNIRERSSHAGSLCDSSSQKMAVQTVPR